MNYRHIYHAGNICDVVKHAVLSLIIDQLRLKEQGFCILDTHAGIGLYDLDDQRSQKTNEADTGIRPLLNAERLPELQSFYEALQKVNVGWDGVSASGFRYYPGSPLVALHNLRPQDRLIAVELHPEDAESLKRQLFPYKQAQVHFRDGYEAMGGCLPPAEKRGLVLIDPPFEVADEFQRLTAALQAAHAKWPQGVYMAWYPIKERPAIWRFHEALLETGMPKILMAEFIFRQETEADQLNGSGLILINPPWKTDEKLSAVFPKLHQALATEHNGQEIKWLREG